MSATSNSTDPVQTVIDLLDGHSAAQWPSGSKPTHIEAHWETTLRVKTNRGDPAAYVQSPSDGTFEHFSGSRERSHDTETVAVEVWATDEADTTALTGDARSLLEDYVADQYGSTEWRAIRVTAEDDRRQEHVVRRTDHYVKSLTVVLERVDDLGT